MNASDFGSRREQFRRLHESGCFVMPNPWDVGSARYLQSLGFPALATTSAGVAFSRGLPDTDWAVPRDGMLQHIARLVAAVDLPVSADFESGYAHAPEAVAVNVGLCVDCGVAGLSIEDATGDPDKPLYDVSLATKRIRAARETIDRSGSGVLLTARAECFTVGAGDPLRQSIARLQAYAEAGADVLYAPGVSGAADIATLVSELRPKPVNVLVSSNTGMTVADLAELGVRRISIGSGLARAAWTGFLRAATALAQQGSFEGFEDALSFTEINAFFRADWKSRQP